MGKDKVQTSHSYSGRANIAEAKKKVFSIKSASLEEALAKATIRGRGVFFLGAAEDLGKSTQLPSGV